MLKPRTLTIPEPFSSEPYRLQARLELLVARHLEGRIQAGLVSGIWTGDGVVLGFYEPYRSGARWRRITGGGSVSVRGGKTYTGLVYASENLSEVASIAERLSNCLGGGLWGVTRIGPRRLAAGVIEVFGDHTIEEAVECVSSNLFDGRLEVRSMRFEGEDRIVKAYSHPGWLHYYGIGEMPYRGMVERDKYYVRIGLSVTNDGFISNARIDGTFNAAPPNEPYNIVSAVLGLPIGEQSIDLMEARLNLAEFYGVEPGDVLEAFRIAVNSARRRIEL